jgi:hypothetical protein
MNRLLTILLLLGATAHGQINNPPTSVNIVDATATGRAVLTAANAAGAATAIGLGTANEVTFNRVQVGGANFTADAFTGGNFVVTGGHALTFSSGGTPGATLTNLGLGAANNVTFSNITASGTLGVTSNATFSGTANLAPSQTADSGSSLMTRDLSDARFPIYETVSPNNNQTAADAANFYGTAVFLPLNFLPSTIQIHAELEFTSSPVAAGATNFRFRTTIRDVEGASMNSSLNTSIVNATSVTNVSGNRYIIKGEITTFPASWSTRLASHETIFLVLDATVFNETGGSLTLVNNQDRRVGYRIFR